MKFLIDINIKSPVRKITYDDSVFLIGSCFTEHIGGRLGDLKFPIVQNPHGILFDPISVCNSLLSYIEPKYYKEEDLFYFNELWQSWQHHSHFSGISQNEVLKIINESQQQAQTFLKNADWIIVTLGSAFHYQLLSPNQPVANCHRAPAQWFEKRLLTIETINQHLETTIEALLQFNNKLKFIFTISPVRHLRDGVVENNRSKSRLIEAVHQVTDNYEKCTYFPAYELVIDVLRDYRFYDVDLSHPNYAATEYVFSKFSENFIAPKSIKIMEDIKKIITAYKHKPFQPETAAHQNFLQSSLIKANDLQRILPHLDFSKEIHYFKYE